MMTIKIIVLLIMLIGVLGTLLPVLPGTPLVLLAAIIYSAKTGFQVISVTNLIILGLVSLLAEGIEYIFTIIGARKFGANKIGLFGGLVGMVLGLILLGPIGIIIGPITGAVLAEFLTGRRLEEALKVGIGSLLGTVSGMLMTFLISIMMSIWIIFKIF